MSRQVGLALVVAATVALGVLAAPAPAAGAATAGTPATATAHRHRPVCATPTGHRAACNAIVDLDAVNPAVVGATPSGYGPADLQAAYSLPSTTAGSGATVAVVVAYDLPTAQGDLTTYRAQYGLPACGAGCFTQVNQDGGSTLPPADASWGQETALDLDMVSAACPRCRILLVEASSTQLSDLGTAVNTAVRLGAVAVSNSYGGSEAPQDTSYDTTYFQHPGVAITASSGDSGYGVSYPAASQYVTAVGGTSLKVDPTVARGFTETAWSSTGSGCSAYDPKPSWQHDTSCPRRTVADVSAVADPSTGVAVYDSTPSGTQQGWLVLGGTSVGAPIVAATFAMAGNPTSTPAALPYASPAALHDVTSGGNGTCGTYLCSASTGYDGPTGLGTPHGTAAFAPAATPVPATDRLGGGQQLPASSGALRSAGGQYRLVLQPDGNLVELGNGNVVFNTGTQGHPGATAEMQPDGNFVIYDVNRGPLFNTRTNGNPGAHLTLQDDGNIAVYGADGRALWASFSAVDGLGVGVGSYDAPAIHSVTDGAGVHPQFLSSRGYGFIALVHGTQLFVGGTTGGATFATPRGAVSATGTTQLVMQDDGNLVLYVDPQTASRQAVWSSRTDGNAGSRAVIQDDGNLVVYTRSGRPLWSSRYGRTY